MGHADTLRSARRQALSPGATFLGGALVLALVFAFLPGLDTWVAGWFYEKGQGFVGAGPGLARTVELAIDGLRWAAIGAPIVILVRWSIGGPLPSWAPAGIAARFLATLALGPGLLVNLILKDQWGRPRPSQITEFDGLLQFQPAFTVSHECWRNCSFVAGHPSLIFAFYAVALALPGRAARVGGVLVVTVAGALVGLGRMTQGAHFLSDVIFSGLFVFAVAWLVDRIARRLPPITPHDLWRRLRRARLVLRLYLARVGRLVAWRERAVGPETRLTLGLVALGFLLALCLGWLDRALALWFKRYDDSAFADVFRVITRLGEAWPYLILSAAGAVGFAWFAAQAADDDPRRRLRRTAHRAAFVFWSIAVAGLISQALKFGLGRARPRVFFADGSYGFDPANFSVDWTSMPSGHTVTAVALALAATMLWRPLWPAALVFAVLVALSRIVITVHYTSDVIVGVLVAIVGVIIVRRFYEATGADFFDAGRQAERTA